MRQWTPEKMLTRQFSFSFFFSVTLCLGFSDAIASDEKDWQFNDGFIIGSKHKINLERFSTSAIEAGTYSVDIYTNSRWRGRYELNVTHDENGKMGICYTPKMLMLYGISPAKLNPELSEKPEFCGRLNAWNDDPNLKDEFNPSALKIDISVPQIYEDRLSQGFVAPQFWDMGVPAFNLSYMANYYANQITSGQDMSDASAYMGLNGGFSWNGWLLKHIGNLSWQQDQGGRWKSNQTYLQRPLPAIKSTVVAGQFSTNGEFFDSVNLRGMSLATNDNMIPDGMRAYAPEIRGIASSNALVTVTQGNSTIYQTSVPPGAFSLTDVYPSGYGNDLIVTVKEADGSEQTFTVPYASVAQLLRPGMMRYSIAAGKVDQDDLEDAPALYQGTLQYGIHNLLTGYGGVIGFNDYQSFLLGVGMNTGFGALSLDITQSQTHFNTGTKRGQSYRATFNRMFANTETNLVLAAYRYSTKDFYNVNDAINDLSYEKHNTEYKSEREKNGFSATISQNLPEGWGGIYISGEIEDYWNRPGTSKEYQLSYNNMWGKLSYSLSAQRVWSNYSGDEGSENRFALNFSYPLWFGEEHTASLNSSTSFTSRHFNDAQIGINGSLGEYNQFSYGVMESVETGGNHNVSLNSTYRSPHSTYSASYSQGEGFRQQGLGASGSFVVHGGGITLSPDSGTTMAIVEAKGAEGAMLTGSRGIQFDSRGYAILPYLRPYRVNEVAIDPKGSSEDVVFNNTVVQAVPYEGSLVKVKFDTQVIKNITQTVRQKDGAPLPFGAVVLDQAGKHIGVVGQGSTVFINSNDATRALVEWNTGKCSFSITAEKNKEVVCH